MYTVTIPSDRVKEIVSSLRRITLDASQAQRECRVALSFIQLEVLPRDNYVELVATACNGYVAAKLRIESQMTQAGSDAFVTYFQPFPYRPGRANVTQQPVTFTFDPEKRESTVTLITMTGKLTYTYDCKAIVDSYASMNRTLTKLYEDSSKEKKAVHYVDPRLLHGALLSAVAVYNKSVKVSIPEGETSPVEVVAVSSGDETMNSRFTLLQLPIRGESY